VQQPQFSSTVTGEFALTYRVTDSNGCQGEDIVVVNVTSDIIVVIDADGDADVCADPTCSLSP
jgi:hypothetical protein